MVRFIIETSTTEPLGTMGFTFQYGQIYYCVSLRKPVSEDNIYIPIWLDLLSAFTSAIAGVYCHLHSNMVRFIIKDFPYQFDKIPEFTFQYGQIYYNNISWH